MWSKGKLVHGKHCVTEAGSMDAGPLGQLPRGVAVTEFWVTFCHSQMKAQPQQGLTSVPRNCKLWLFII